MSEVRIVIRELEADWWGDVHGSVADRAIAACSADPLTLAELEAAMARYAMPTKGRSFLGRLSHGIHDEPYDAGLVVIDLVARLVLTDSTYSSPDHFGEVTYHDGEKATETYVLYQLAEDWVLTRDRFQWSPLAKERRQQRAAKPVIGIRKVLYGRPLLEFIARETFAAAGDQSAADDHAAAADQASGDECDTIKTIHAAWLMTPRDDLDGATPREVALADHKHLAMDLQNQEFRWSFLRKSPPGLDKSSFAYRYSAFGTHESVIYYDLVRELLESCRDRAREFRAAQADASSESFVADEIARLETLRDEWLDSPNPEYHGWAPQWMIERERARLPMVMSGHDAVHDAVCPCCQMLADMPGPMFWHLDGCNMDEDFAFDISHQTREEWEAEKRRWEEFNKQFNEEMAQRKLAGGQQEDDVPWPAVSSPDDDADLPIEIRIFKVAADLANLIGDLREDPAGQMRAAEAQPLIDQLNRDFGNVREVLQNTEPSVAVSLLDPVMDRLRETLASVASIRGDLADKCEGLIETLSKLLDVSPPETSSDDEDCGMPF